MNKYTNIFSKFRFACKDMEFNDILFFWKNKIGAIIKEADNFSILFIDKECIKRMEELDEIPVDCRIFAMIYSNMTDEGCSIMLQKNGNGIEIDVPTDCFYLSLSKKINKIVAGNEIKMILDDDQGYWITKTGKNSYIGITSDGIMENSLEAWFSFYGNCVKDKIKDIENKLKHIRSGMDFIYKQAAVGILSINIKIEGFILSQYSFDMLGTAIENSTYDFDKKELSRISHY